jgi:ABC-type glycerol-3-phosphate transport system permease component
MNRRPKTSVLVIQTIIAVIIAAYVLFPFYMVLTNTAKTTTGIVNDPLTFAGMSFGNFVANISGVINNTHFMFWKAFGCSVVITVFSVVLLDIFGAMAGWVISRNQKKKWASFIYFTFIASMIIPFQVVMLPLVANFKRLGDFIGIHMNYSIPGIIFAYLGFGGAMTVFILTGFIKSVPYDLEESASIDGCSPEGTFFKIIFPLLRPVIMTVTILNGMWIWNDFLLPSMMLGLDGDYKTIPVAVQSFVGSYVTEWNMIMAAALLAMIPMIVVFLFGQKQIVQGMIDGAVKG